MKIVFTGGATGGHFYPLIAVAEAIHQVVAERRLLEPKLFYIAPTPFDEEALFANAITYVHSPAGKVRRYVSARNFTDVFVTLSGTLSSLITLFKIYPDVVFSKGGFASVPTVLAAHFLGIPIVIHESDSKFGRANKLAARYAYRIGVAFDSAAEGLPPKQRAKVARTGIPIRSELELPESEGAKSALGLVPLLPTILIMGGSLGSQRINEMILTALPELIAFANIIHQTGKDNFKDVEAEASVVLEGNANRDRYHVFPYLSAQSIRQAASAADLIVSRAGTGAIAEISHWKKPAILIPIPESVSHDQRTNAYAYAHTGAAIVLEEANMTGHVLMSEIKRLTSDLSLAKEMGEKGAAFGSTDAARVIAEELLSIGLAHEPAQGV